MNEAGKMHEAATVLHAAVIEGDFDKVINILRDNNIFIGLCLCDALRCPQGAFNEPTVLTLAVDCGHIDLVRKLLEFGSEYYSTGRSLDLLWLSISGNSIPQDLIGAMVHAAMIDRLDIIQLVAEFRIFKDSRTNDSYKDIVSQAKEHEFGLLRTFLNKMMDKSTALKGWKGHNLMNLLLLHQCPTSCIQLMIDHGIGVNGWDLNGLTPLRCAVLSKTLENIQFLLNKGADVYAPQLQGDRQFKDDGTFTDDTTGDELLPGTSIYTVLPYRSRLVLRLLATGPTTVMYAASVRNIPNLQLILESAPDHIGFCHHVSSFYNGPGVFIFCGNGSSQGDTPLNYAVHYGTLETVSMILEHEEARKNITHGTIDLALCLNKLEVFDVLLQNVKDFVLASYRLKHSHGFSQCAVTNMKQFHSCLINYYCLKNITKSDFSGIVFDAIDNGFVESIDVLSKMPCFNVSSRSKYNVATTFLMYSCYKAKDDFARIFMNMGANFDARNNSGKTAIMCTAHNSNVKCFEILMEAHADLDKTTKDGFTVFYYSMYGDGNSLEILLKSGRVIDKKTLKLKEIHKKALFKFAENNTIGLRIVMLLMKYRVFNWDWCPRLHKVLHHIAFAAVTLGISPGIFQIRSATPKIYFRIFKQRSDRRFTSLLLFAFDQGDNATVRYLLANFYFLPEDFSLLRTKSIKANNSTQHVDSPSENLLGPLLFQPLSLHHWCILVISKAITPSNSILNERSSLVDSFPLPKTLLNELKFKTKFSQLCHRHWLNLGSQSCDDKAQIDDWREGW